MRFSQFISEAVSNFDMGSGLAAISNNCHPFLDSSGVSPLFRGIRSTAKVTKHLNDKDVQFQRHPFSRAPKDSDKKFNFVFNSGIQLAFGVEQIRKQTIFCTGNYEQAAEYGDVNYIFPKGQFKFIWSPEVDDSYNSNHIIYEELRIQLLKNGLRKSGAIASLSKALEQLSESMLDNFLSGTDEIINETKKIYERNGLARGEKDFYQLTLDSLKQTFKNIYKADDLKSAIDSNNEILIYESGGYFSIDVDTAIAYVKRGQNTKPGANSIFGAYQHLLEEINE